MVEYNEELLAEEEESQHALIVAMLIVLALDFDTSKSRIDNVVRSWYSKYGKDNKMSYLESRKRIPKLKTTKRNLLLQQLGLEIEKLGSNQQQQFITLMKKLVPGITVDTILNTKWADDGLTFAQRVAKDKLEMKAFAEQTIMKATASQQSADEVVAAFDKKVETMKKRANTRFRTEAVALITLAVRDAYRTDGVRKYTYRAVLDERTTETCKGMDGKVFYVSDMKVGVNAPPMHQNCRSYTVPLREDE